MNSAADAAVAASAPVVVASTPPDPAQGLRLALGGFGAFLLFFSIQTYGSMVAQGVVEGANIQPVFELTKMMSDMRDFEFASQMVDGNGQLEQSAIDRIGRRS